MKNIFKLALLSAAASLLLALPVAASAESRTQVITVDQTLETTTLPIEVITRPTPSIEVVPLTISHYWGTVNLLPEGEITQNNSRMLPMNFNYSVKSIEITGTNSNLVYAKTWNVQHPIDWYTNPYSQVSNETGISFYSLGGAATVTVKVTNDNNEWGYFIVNVSPPAVDHFLGTVNLYPAKGVPDTFEVTLPSNLKVNFDIGEYYSFFNAMGPGSFFVKAERTNNGAKISFSTSLMAKTTVQWRIGTGKGEWGYYIINVLPKGYCLPPV
jgi:hypothetical protein